MKKILSTGLLLASLLSISEFASAACTIRLNEAMWSKDPHHSALSFYALNQRTGARVDIGDIFTKRDGFNKVITFPCGNDPRAADSALMVTWGYSGPKNYQTFFYNPGGGKSCLFNVTDGTNVVIGYIDGPPMSGARPNCITQK